MVNQHTVYAATEAEILSLLARHQIIDGGGKVRDGMGYAYRGPWADAHGAPMASVCGLIWWAAEPASAGEAQEREDMLAALRSDRALYEGPAPIYGMGTTGYVDPVGWEWIKRERDARKLRAGYKVGAKWFHSDAISRDQQLGLVLAGASNLIPSGLQWKTMDGSFVTMTATLAQQVFAAAMASDMAHHAVAEAAKASLEAGTLTDLRSIQWPKGFGE